MRSLTVPALIVGALGALLLREVLVPPRPAPAAPAPAAVAPAPPAEARAAALDRAAMRAEIRATLHQELEAQQPPAPPAEPTTEQRDAHQHATTLVARAAADRRWTHDDVLELRTLFIQMNVDQRDEVLRTLIPAINRGDIAVEPGTTVPF